MATVKFVVNPLRNWKEMNGTSNLSRKINAYLASVLHGDRPEVNHRFFSPLASEIITQAHRHDLRPRNRRETLYTILNNSVPCPADTDPQIHDQKLKEMTEALFLLLSFEIWAFAALD